MCLVVGCDYGGDTTDNDPVYCTGDKADDPNCVVVEPTESPPTEETEGEVEELQDPVPEGPGCSKLEHIAGVWWDIDYGNKVTINTMDMSTTCKVKIEGTGVKVSLIGTELPLEYQDEKYHIYMHKDGGYLILEVFIYEQHASTRTLTR